MLEKILSVITALAMLLGATPAAAAEPASPESAAATLYSYGLFRGTGEDNLGNPVFELDRTMTRQEAVTMLVRLLGKEDAAKSGNWSTPYADIADWAKPYVGYAYANGLTKGTSSETFGGSSTVTAEQYDTFLLRALGYSSTEDFQWDAPWELSDKVGITDGDYSTGCAFIRGDAALLSLNTVNAKLKGSSKTLYAELVDSGAVSAYEMTVSFIDVGQADCILVESLGSYMLIDAGNNADSTLVVNYLNDRGVTELEYAIGTHPHEDHIGGLDAVIENFQVDTLIMPDITSTSKTFEDVLDAAEEKNLSVTLPVVGKTYTLGSAEFTIIAPCDDYGTETNDWSVGIKLVNGSNSFVMCGDAESDAEADMVAKFGSRLKADVLKCGHHGSRTSTSDEFLKAVDPTFAVISCETGNSYGHPHAETLEKLSKAGIKLFRTDLQGTIIAASDGSSIEWNLAPCA